MFTNRYQAGEALAQRLKEVEDIKPADTVVLSIPRGGIPVGAAIAAHFHLPQDCIITKKIRAPQQKELALGAVGKTTGSLLLNYELIKDLGVSQAYLEEEISNRREEILRQEKLYRNNRLPVDLQNKTVLLVDDGVATGSTMVAAIREVFENRPKRVVVALPVCPLDTLSVLEKEADGVIALETPKTFTAISEFYEDFSQISDEEVINQLTISN